MVLPVTFIVLFVSTQLASQAQLNIAHFTMELHVQYMLLYVMCPLP